MEPMTEMHVDYFLSVLEPTRGLAVASRAIGTAVKQDAATRRDFDAIREWLSAPRFEKDAKEALDTLLPVAYLRAQDGLRTADLSSIEAVRKRVQRARAAVEKLEPDFLPSLVKETKQRAAQNPVFASNLKQARAAFNELQPDFESLRQKVGPQQKLRCRLFQAEVDCWIAIAAGVLIFGALKL